MRRNENYMLREIAGESLLVPTGELSTKINGLINLNIVATFIWKHLEECENPDDMAKLLMENFEVEEEIALRDAYGFINTLIENEMAFCD